MGLPGPRCPLLRHQGVRNRQYQARRDAQGLPNPCGLLAIECSIRPSLLPARRNFPSILTQQFGLPLLFRAGDRWRDLLPLQSLGANPAHVSIPGNNAPKSLHTPQGEEEDHGSCGREGEQRSCKHGGQRARRGLSARCRAFSASAQVKSVEFMVADAMAEANGELQIVEALNEPERYLYLDDHIIRDIEKSTGSGGSPPSSFSSSLGEIRTFPRSHFRHDMCSHLLVHPPTPCAPPRRSPPESVRTISTSPQPPSPPVPLAQG